MSSGKRRPFCLGLNVLMRHNDADDESLRQISSVGSELKANKRMKDKLPMSYMCTDPEY